MTIMSTHTTIQQLVASSLCLLLFACSTTGHAPAGPSSPADLSRYVLIIKETPDGQLSHAWRPSSGFDLSGYPHHASSGQLEGLVVRASFNRDCEAEADACEDMCMASLKGRHWTHASKQSKREMCRRKCSPAYQDCCKLRELAEATRPRVSFPAVAGAINWLKQNHRELLVGTVVVIAGVTFVVVAAGTGGAALVLAPAVLLASTDAPSAFPLAEVEP